MPTGQGRLVAGRHELLAQIGRGGMGTVWRAHDRLLDREVALKEIALPHGLSDAERDTAVRRAFREARAAARLRHPGIVTIFDVVEEDGTPWIVMDLVLADSLAALGRLPESRVVPLALQLVDALRTAHAAGVIHRDVKPANVLVTPTGQVVLTDFGIALTPGDPVLTSTGALIGSPAYIAPERLNGAPATPAADLWSLGATLYTAIEGHPPYPQPDPLAVLAAVLTQHPAPTRRARLLAPVIRGLLTRDPSHRLTADACTRLLTALANTPPEPAPPYDLQPTEHAPDVRFSVRPAPERGAVDPQATVLTRPRRRPKVAGTALLVAGATSAVALGILGMPLHAAAVALAAGVTWAWLPLLYGRRR
ncbi:serine/threonine protein kinase [Nonomuraea sp. NBC_01738]|uniref:serine/threonine-protein kinase n=1 Tax=Nonomuraea sp. NBC_01738 TaxID=2976003 RepID=UPI002E137123|nr:serine/threonine protein kinase [Nonomuraea sp. NBC_01738]